MKKLKKLTALLLALLTVLSLAACGAAPAKEPEEEEVVKTKMDEIKEAGVLVVGTSADYPPYEFHAQINGEDTIVGFDMAIAKYFADSLGVELKIVDMNFDNLLISLAQGEFDLVMAGLTPSEKRKLTVDFTDVFFTNKQIIIIRTEDADTYKTKEDLVGHKGCVQTGTVQVDIANEIVGEENTVGLVKFQDQIMELKNGKVDCVFTNTLTASGYVAANPDLMIQDIGIEVESSGFAGAVQKGHEEFVEYLNTVITEMNEQGLVEQYIADAQALNGVEE